MIKFRAALFKGRWGCGGKAPAVLGKAQYKKSAAAQTGGGFRFPLPFAEVYGTLRAGKSDLSALSVTVDGSALLTGAASCPLIL